MLVRHSSIYLLARAGPSLLGLLGIAIYTRLLNPAEYGLFTLIVTGASLSQVWMFEWLRLSALRFLARFRDRRAAFGSSLAVGFLAASALTLPLGAGVALFGLLPANVVAVGALLLVAFGLFGVMGTVAWADLAPWRFTIMTLAQGVLILAIGVPALHLGFGPLGLAWAMAIATLAAVIHPLVREWPHLRFAAARFALVRSCWRYGLPLSLASGFGLVVMTSDRFMIAWLMDTGAAGTFAAGYWIAAHPIGALLTVVSQAAIPLAINAYERKDADAARAQLGRNLTLLLAIGLPATAGLCLTSEDLAVTMLGAEFRAGATPVMPWIALGALLHGVTAYHFNATFQLAQRTLPMAAISLSAAALNLALNFWWIPIFGLIGAAAASIVSHGFALTWTGLWGHRIFALPRPDRGVLQIAAATAAMALAVWVVPLAAGALGLAVRVVTGGAVYAAVLVALDVGGIRGTLIARVGAFRQAGGG